MVGQAIIEVDSSWFINEKIHQEARDEEQKSFDWNACIINIWYVANLRPYNFFGPKRNDNQYNDTFKYNAYRKV